jgi:hypothetical protein
MAPRTPNPATHVADGPDTPAVKDPSERIRFLTYRGKRMLYMDFSEMNAPGEYAAAFEAAKKVIAAEPENSLLTLTDVTGTRYDGDMITAFQELAAHNKPYVKAAASVTRTPLQLVALRASAVLSKRNLRAFGDLDEAKEWLVTQA